jgi:hypothetical protein
MKIVLNFIYGKLRKKYFFSSFTIFKKCFKSSFEKKISNIFKIDFINSNQIQQIVQNSRLFDEFLSKMNPQIGKFYN